MRMFAAKTAIFVVVFGTVTSLSAEDATTVLLDRLDRGACDPSSLSEGSWTIGSGPIGTHGELNWGDRVEFEPRGSISGHNNQSSFNVWKNGIPWRSADGWNGSCVRDGTNSIYVVTGNIHLDGCLHELAFGRLDHTDSLSHRIEVIFAHAQEHGTCLDGHGGDSYRHPGHSHGDKD